MVLSSINNKSDSAIKVLDLSGVFVHDDFSALLKQMRESRELEVHADFHLKSPIERLQEFIKTNKEAWVEAFVEYDELDSWRVLPEEFLAALQKLGFEFNLEERTHLIGKLRKDSLGRLKYKDPLLGFPKETLPSDVPNTASVVPSSKSLTKSRKSTAKANRSKSSAKVKKSKSKTSKK